MIVLHCVTDKKSEQYAVAMHWSALKMLSSPGSVSYIHHPIVTAGSTGHADGIKAALLRADPLLQNVIVDSDVVFLMKGWNMWLEEALTQHKVVGSTYEDIGRFSTGHGPIQSYKKRPNMTLFGWSQGVEMASLDPHPDKQRFFPVLDNCLSERYNLPIGSSLLCDVGWQVPAHLDSLGIVGLGLENFRLNELPGFEACHPSNELFVTPDGKPFAAHQRGSSRSPFKGDANSQAFYEAVDRFLK